MKSLFLTGIILGVTCNPPPPILSKLDRVLINPDWDSILPNCSLTSLPRTTSDHYPLKIEIFTNIPKPSIFRYCNNWVLKLGFKDLVSSTWDLTHSTEDAAGILGAKLRVLRQKAKESKKTSNQTRLTWPMLRKPWIS
jgi:hypothetical protein